MIGLQVAPVGTEDPEEKPEVCHLTGGDPSVPRTCIGPTGYCGPAAALQACFRACNENFETGSFDGYPSIMCALFSPFLTEVLMKAQLSRNRGRANASIQ